MIWAQFVVGFLILILTGVVCYLQMVYDAVEAILYFSLCVLLILVVLFAIWFLCIHMGALVLKGFGYV